MVIGFHYHIPIKLAYNGKYLTQSFYGLFLDALSAGCKQLIVFSYTPIASEDRLINYELTATNIRVINLGPHNSLPKRLARFPKAYVQITQQLSGIDVFLIRSPTPLLPIITFLKHKVKVILYLVGDYREASKALPPWRAKTILIKILSWWVEHAQKRIAQNNLVISNSLKLLDDYKTRATQTILIKSTTLSTSDILKRDDTCQGAIIKVLYTGRLDPLKGLDEILEACERLTKTGMNLEFHMAGLIAKGLESYPDELIKKANQETMKGKVFNHGLKKVGAELNALYRAADVYVIASQSDFEGFPRTIWEAMANGLPVIATRVGSIPDFLQHERDAVLIPPRNVDALTEALKNVISNRSLRQKLMQHGYVLAEENTLGIQGKRMTDTLKKWIDRSYE